MERKRVILYYVVCSIGISRAASRIPDEPSSSSNYSIDRKRPLEVFPGFNLIFGADEFRIQLKVLDMLAAGENAEGRKKEEEQSGLQKFGSMMMMIPVLLQLLSLPGALASIKLSLLKSLMVAKLALAIVIFNALRNSQTKEEVVIHQTFHHKHYSHYPQPYHLYGNDDDNDEDSGWFGKRRRR